MASGVLIGEVSIAGCRQMLCTCRACGALWQGPLLCLCLQFPAMMFLPLSSLLVLGAGRGGWRCLCRAHLWQGRACGLQHSARHCVHSPRGGLSGQDRGAMQTRRHCCQGQSSLHQAQSIVGWMIEWVFIHQRHWPCKAAIPCVGMCV